MSFFYTLKLLLGKMSWESLGRIGGGGGSFCLQKMRGKCHFLFPLSIILSNACVTRGSTGLDMEF